MLGSIYIGLSGMEAFSKGLQTISSNVANLDTLGFKGQTVSFSDLYNPSSTGISYDMNRDKALNANGVSFAESKIDFTQGTLQQTSNALDLAIQGSGMLVVQDKGGQIFYTRTGQFSVDKDNYISLQSNGYRLSVLDSRNGTALVNLTSKQSNAPVATSNVSLGGNLSSSATTASVSNITVYDSLGGARVWNLTLTPVSGSTGRWTVAVSDSSGTSVGTGQIAFNAGIADPTASKVTVSLSAIGGSSTSVTLDFSNVSSYSTGTTSNVTASSVDGNAAGTLSSVTVDQTGQVLLTYSNSKTLQVGSVAIAEFKDPQQLERAGSGLFINNRGAAVSLLSSGQSGAGTLVSKQLESSNVDLSASFGSLILIQRGFQASSQVVSVTNDMIQELFNMRGHG